MSSRYTGHPDTATRSVPRARDVSGGWHHGDDIFAPLGAPLLAVADGTVFSVGWNNVGGWRLWLRDRKGNEFYYAHLSAYTKLAHNGARVKAGQVLGFVGNTGDAQGTPFHLHFEVHPVSMLFLGYDGAVNPTEYLDAWKRLDDVRILPAVPFAQPQAEISKNAPAPGAILLEASDISTANGLDPASLKRAMRGQPRFDVTGPASGSCPRRCRTSTAPSRRCCPSRCRPGRCRSRTRRRRKLLLQPATRLRPRERVVEQADHDAGQEQEPAAAVVLLASLEAVRGLPELGDRHAEVVLDVLVAGDALGDSDDARGERARRRSLWRPQRPASRACADPRR